MNTTKRNYYQKDLLDWCSYGGIQLKWPDTFPLRTVLPLRVTLAANSDSNLITQICRFSKLMSLFISLLLQFELLGKKTKILGMPKCVHHDAQVHVLVLLFLV